MTQDNFVLTYKCRRCLAITHGSQVSGQMAWIVAKNEPNIYHACADGATGFTDYIGMEPVTPYGQVSDVSPNAKPVRAVIRPLSEAPRDRPILTNAGACQYRENYWKSGRVRGGWYFCDLVTGEYLGCADDGPHEATSAVFWLDVDTDLKNWGLYVNA